MCGPGTDGASIQLTTPVATGVFKAAQAQPPQPPSLVFTVQPDQSIKADEVLEIGTLDADKLSTPVCPFTMGLVSCNLGPVVTIWTFGFGNRVEGEQSGKRGWF